MRNKPDPPPPPHCLLDEDVVENLPTRPPPWIQLPQPHAYDLMWSFKAQFDSLENSTTHLLKQTIMEIVLHINI